MTVPSSPWSKPTQVNEGWLPIAAVFAGGAFFLIAGVCVFAVLWGG